MTIQTPADNSIRQFVISLMGRGDARTIVDIGCGKGVDLLQIAGLRPNAAELIGLDREVNAEAFKGNTKNDRRLRFLVADLDTLLPLASESVDIAFSKNVLECIVDKDAHIKEIHRVLRPGGQVICAHYDWDSMAIDGVVKDLTRKLIHAFGDWQQAWMKDCDSWMGRRLWRTFQSSGLFKGSIQTKVLTETEFVPGTYGYETIHSFDALTRRGIIAPGEYPRFIADIEELASRGEYFYSITMYVYTGLAL